MNRVFPSMNSGRLIESERGVIITMVPECLYKTDGGDVFKLLLRAHNAYAVVKNYRMTLPLDRNRRKKPKKILSENRPGRSGRER